ncbi:hypothetical protein QYM36_006854 [Artemia franciscana]|uniref:SMP domain-containing protein n=1 Tax=Artemia franciscana TaxID=6661 RepID=A0AA88L4K4_ARTSF|nr:hypothetical protein QYM36_006854 [Artemia franciscana]
MDIGHININANLQNVDRRDAAAIQSVERKLLGYNPPGGLASEAQSAAALNEGIGQPMNRGISTDIPAPADIDVDRGTASKDFGHVRFDVDLNQVRPEEAAALQAAESKIEGLAPSITVGGIGSAAQSMAAFNEREQSETGPFHPGIKATEPLPGPTYYQGVELSPSALPTYAPDVSVFPPSLSTNTSNVGAVPPSITTYSPDAGANDWERVYRKTTKTTQRIAIPGGIEDIVDEGKLGEAPRTNIRSTIGNVRMD